MRVASVTYATDATRRLSTLALIALVAGVISVSGPLPAAAAAPTSQNQAASSTDHPMGCSPSELWVDAQDWWATTPGRKGRDGDPGDDFGHLHTGLCFPQKGNLKGVVTLRVRSVLHDNPGRFRQIQVQLYQGDSANVVAGELRFDRTLDSCSRTGGESSDHGMTCTWWDNVRVDTRQARYDGEVQLRVRAFVGEPDGKDMRTSTSLHAYLRNGGRRWYDDLYQNLDDLEGRGWYTNLNYAAARLRSSTTLREPLSGTVRFAVSLVRGADGADVTGWYAGVDTDFHNDNPGTPLCPSGVREANGIPQCGDGPFKGSLTLDTRRLQNGWHRLFLKVDQYDRETGSTHSGVMATYFRVQN